MPNIKSQQKKITDNIVEGKLSRDYSNDPFFKKKKEDAIAFLKERGLFEKLTQMPENKK